MPQVQKRGGLVLFVQYVQVAGEESLSGIPEDIHCQVRQGLKAGAHIPVAAKAADPRDKNIVALAAQSLHMAQEDFQGETGLVDGPAGPALQHNPVRGAADNGLHTQFIKKGVPERTAAVIEHRSGQANDRLLFCLHV